MPSKIFVSYRREDAAAEAARIRDRLTTLLGSDNVFMDVDALKPGQRFDQELSKALSTCNVFLAIIGPLWYDLAYTRAQADGIDYVRQEIATALARDITVIPILIDRAVLPSPEALPDDLRPLVLHQAYQIRHEHFGRDIEALIAALSVKPDRTSGRTTVGWRRIGIVASCVWAIGGFFYGNNLEIEAGSRWYDLAFSTCKYLADTKYQGQYDQWARKNPKSMPWDPDPTRPASPSYQNCHEEAAEKARKLHWNNAWISGVALAIIPVPFGWLLGWIIFRLGRWIRSGFKLT
jgi:hypothetical protein